MMSIKESKELTKEFYANDIVYRFDKNKRIVFGMVSNSYDYETSSDLSDNPLQKGQIRVLWNNCSREQVWRQNKVKLLSRSIMPGEIVRRLVKGKETQRGYCKSTNNLVTLQIVGTDKVVENVSSSRLKGIRIFEVDDAVCLGTKVGRIGALDQEVIMSSKCGSVVQILLSINHDIEDYWMSKKNGELLDACYPGQELICTPNNFEEPLWIKKSKQMKRNMQNRQRFTVQSVKECMVEVAWYSGSEGTSTITELKPEDLQDLKVLEHSYDFLESRRLLKLKSCDSILKKKNWIKKQTAFFRRELKNKTTDSKSSSKGSKISSLSTNNREIKEQDDEGDWLTDEEDDNEDGGDNNGDCDGFGENISKGTTNGKPKKKHYPPRPDDLLPGNTVAVEILCMESKATVVWQDGTEESNIPTTQLYYSISLDEHEFFPGEWVTQDDKNVANKYGSVESVNYLERTARVRWFNYDPLEKKQVETGLSEVSVYDMKKHPKFLFRPSSIVRAIPPQENKMGRVIDSSPLGYARVKWIDGSEENCCPNNIEIIPESADYEHSDSFNSDSEGEMSWETESIESFAGNNTDETTLQNMASRLDFIRNRVIYLKEAFKKHTFQENISFLRDLLLVYDNSSYLDKLLGTSFFSLKSKHFQVILSQAKERAKTAGVELKGRLFVNDNLCPSTTKMKTAEKENINKVLKLENKVNAQIESNKEEKNAIPELISPEITELSHITQENLCVELLSMLKLRMDLAYAELISRIDGRQALSIMTQASENITLPISSTPLPTLPTTPEESFSSLSPPKLLPSLVGNVENKAYFVIEEAPTSHHFYNSKFEPTDFQRFLKSLQKEYSLLRESLPPGVWVRSFGNRIDLLSVSIEGPANTPYEDGLFLFDIQLCPHYPRSPPLVHYISYSSEKLNPNLYVEGKVCISLLGTWMGRGTEVWGPNSTLLQLIVSIQGLILVAEPYFNEAGYMKQTETQQGYENSRTYNELVILKLVQSMTEMLLSPPEIFKQEVYAHFALKGKKLCQRLQKYCNDTDPLKPDFPLLPVSKGLKLSLTSALNSFQEVLKNVLSNNASNKIENSG